MEYELDNLSEKFTVTGIDEQMEEELKQYGKLGIDSTKHKLNYHLDLTPEENSKLYTISFVKGLYSYGYDKNLWEVAIIARKKRGSKADLKGIKGWLTDKELLDYVRDSAASLADPEYFENLPKEF